VKTPAPVPYTDPVLRRDPKEYARLIADLHSRGLVTLGREVEPTVGVFVVPKKKGKLRLIFDTRAANLKFRPPAHASLPTAAAWTGLEVPGDEDLVLRQVDVNNAFYRIAVPDGMEDYFVLPRVSREELARLLDDGLDELPETRYLSPKLLVLAMGFSGSLYFCQRMVERCVVRSGIPERQLLLDRRTAPCLLSGKVGGGVYVDGVAVFGTDEHKVEQACAAVRVELEKAGLECGEGGGDDEGQVFTGLRVDRETGRVSPTIKRLWRL